MHPTEIEDELDSIRKRHRHLSRVARTCGEHDLAEEAKALEKQAEEMISELESRRGDYDWLKGLVAFVVLFGSLAYTVFALLRSLSRLLV